MEAFTRNTDDTAESEKNKEKYFPLKTTEDISSHVDSTMKLEGKDMNGVEFVNVDETSHLDLDDDEEENVRHSWARKTEYILSMIGYCVGIGNVWRFPYICIRNGGGAFLIPFIICLLLCGLPLYFMEVALGQFLAKSSLHVFEICPLLKGVGVAVNLMSLICACEQSMIIGWMLIFLPHCFRDPLPWTLCGQWWNSDKCVPTIGQTQAGAVGNGTMIGMDGLVRAGHNITFTADDNNFTEMVINSSVANRTTTKSASEEFWLNNVLELSPGFEHLNGLPWHTSLALAVSILVTTLGIIKGVKSVGKVVYVTATLPYILITILIIKGATLDGAGDGVLFYLKPDFSKLLETKTWIEASIQVFYSLGPCWGGLITMASYNKFNNNCLRDSVVLTLVCEGSSFFAGFAIFTVLGHMSHVLGVPIQQFSQSGAGLAFVVYPEAISYLPVPQLWAVLFFGMLLTVGLDSQFVNFETALTTIADMWPKFGGRREAIGKCLFMTLIFLICLPLATRGGMYIFQLIDWYLSAVTTVCVGVLECVMVSWVYGAHRFLKDVELMIGKKPPYIFVVLWRFVTPAMLSVVFVFTLKSYTPPTVDQYVYGEVLQACGWVLSVSTFVPIPAWAIYKLYTTQGNIFERLRTTCTASSQWRPAEPSLREQYLLSTKHESPCAVRLPCYRS
ncbi:sodium- and chloride-dependent GABA transporter 2 [Aplysia californica]|uniref:Transporter n=1 Tax=Aplysia californica TaxID=6500 RepID=A0ABM1VQL5_APLCA|nr:sodium- and chloride-dependent GABA transporter 2 [Aplysia californica]XP_035824708.1 sodium- and chloride-dependent GABA transporter 2 [Aplysia californica]